MRGDAMLFGDELWPWQRQRQRHREWTPRHGRTGGLSYQGELHMYTLPRTPTSIPSIHPAHTMTRAQVICTIGAALGARTASYIRLGGAFLCIACMRPPAPSIRFRSSYFLYMRSRHPRRHQRTHCPNTEYRYEAVTATPAGKTV